MTAALRLEEPPDADTYCPGCQGVLEADGACPGCDLRDRVATRDDLAEQHLARFGWDVDTWAARRDERHAWFLRAMEEEGLPAIAGDWDAFNERCWSVAAERAREIARDPRSDDETRQLALDVLNGMGIDLDPEPAMWPEPAEEPCNFPF